MDGSTPGDGSGERIDLGELEAFLTLAEELHFGRTAARLRLSQPRVSQLIRALERRIGGRLFERSSRRVGLTPLGARLRDGARPAHQELRRAVLEARRFARGLRIGFLGPFSSTITDAVAAFRSRHPDCAVGLRELDWTDVFGPLRRSELDLQVTLWPVEQPDLTVGPVVGEFPRILAVGTGHPLADRPSVGLQDLAGVPVIQPADSVPPELRRSYWPPATTPDGRPVRQAQPARTAQEILAAVADGRSAYLTSTALPMHYHHPGVAFVPFTGLPPARAVLCWHTAGQTDRILEFAELARASA